MPADQTRAEQVKCRLDEVLSDKGMTLMELSAIVGVSYVNLSVLKNGHARAVRFSTLAALCDALSCQVGDLFEYESLESS